MCQAGTLRAESTCVVLSVGLAAEPQHTQGRRLKAGRSSLWDLDISNGKVSKDGQGVSHTQRLQTHWGPPSSPEGQAALPPVWALLQAGDPEAGPVFT